MSKKFCLVYYYVPEDKDDPEVPNAFGINLSQEEIKLSDIRNMFPLEGEYIFRFKYKSSLGFVWMDIPEDSKIPLFNGKITVKANRISWEGKSKPSTTYQEDTKVTNKVEPQPVKQEPKVQQQNFKQEFSAADLNLLGTVGSSTITFKEDTNNKSNNNNNGGFDDIDLLASHQPPKKNVTSTQNQHDDLLSFDQPSTGSYTKSTNSSSNTSSNLTYKDLF